VARGPTPAPTRFGTLTAFGASRCHLSSSPAPWSLPSLLLRRW
jgi:hypothetical protein